MSKKRVLMMYEDGSFIVIAMEEYNKHILAGGLRADMEIFQDFFSLHEEKNYCVRIPHESTKLVSLSELPEETRSLVVLYEV